MYILPEKSTKNQRLFTRFVYLRGLESILYSVSAHKKLSNQEVREFLFSVQLDMCHAVFLELFVLFLLQVALAFAFVVALIFRVLF